jgi:hypothetical protein
METVGVAYAFESQGELGNMTLAPMLMFADAGRSNASAFMASHHAIVKGVASNTA